MPGVRDPVLQAYFEAPDDAQADLELERLLTVVAAPVIRDVLRGRLYGASERERADDLTQDALLQLTRRLRSLRHPASTETPIEQFKAYVAVVTLRVCDAFVRRRFPERHRLRNRIRYVLTRHPACALEASPDGLWCRLRAWPGGAVATSGDRLRALTATPSLVPVLARADAARVPLADIVPAVLEWAGGPVALDALTSALADILGVHDNHGDARVRGASSADTLAVPSSHDTRVEARSYLRWLWTEVEALPVRQRIALLLSLRDENGGGVLPLFVLTGVATFAALCTALEVDPAELRIIWPTLPADDTTLAVRLGATRQQVINLRKAARHRLMRRRGRIEQSTKTLAPVVIPPDPETST